MVKALLLSAGLVAASLASVVQAAPAKLSPLWGCKVFATGPLGIGLPNTDNGLINSTTRSDVSFVAGHTQKSLITGDNGYAVLDTRRRTGQNVTAQTFDFLDCTGTLWDQGYNVTAVPQILVDLPKQAFPYTYVYGILRASGEDEDKKDCLSVRSGPDSKLRLDDQHLLSTPCADIPAESRTFILATADGKLNNYIAWYPVSKTGTVKSGLPYIDDNKWGSISISTNHEAHPDAKLITLYTPTAP